MTFEARPATASDVAAIESVIHRAYEKYVERMDRKPAPMTADYVRLVADRVVTENLGYYARRGFTEFDRRLHEGYDRVFFERPVAPG